MPVSLKAMIEAHDDIAAKNYEDSPDSVPIITSAPPVSQHFPTGPPTDAIRMVGIRKTPEEPLVRSHCRTVPS